MIHEKKTYQNNTKEQRRHENERQWIEGGIVRCPLLGGVQELQLVLGARADEEAAGSYTIW